MREIPPGGVSLASRYILHNSPSMPECISLREQEEEKEEEEGGKEGKSEGGREGEREGEKGNDGQYRRGRTCQGRGGTHMTLTREDMGTELFPHASTSNLYWRVVS